MERARGALPFLMVAAAAALAPSAAAQLAPPAPSAHEALCGGGGGGGLAGPEGGACLGVPGRMSSRFMQAKTVHVDDAGGFARLQGEAVVRGTAHLGGLRLEPGVPLQAEDTAARTIQPPRGAANIRLAANLQVNGRVVFAERPEVLQAEPEQRAAPRPLGGVPANQAVAFLEEAVSVVSHEDGQQASRQWRLVAHDHAEGAAEHWTLGAAPAPLLRCHPEDASAFVASRAAAGATEVPPLRRRVGPLPPHTHLELTARLHLLDAWRGGTAYAKVDGGLAWLQAHGQAEDHAAAPGVSLCGSGFPHDRLSVPVKVIVPHSAEYVDVEFGGVVPAAGDAAHAAALGVDDVAVLVN